MAAAAVTNEASKHISMSHFLDNMLKGLNLCSKERSSIAHLKLFWSHGTDDDLLKEKIKSFLQLLDFLLIPTLVQFWAPIRNQEKCFLDTIDQPFGLSVLREGLCCYRKHCVEHKYSVDGGPPGRVFRNGVLEFCPFVKFYSENEFPLRDFALDCGIWGYLALPVVEPLGYNCVGVLEFVTIFDGSFYLTDKIKQVSEMLKAVGLRSPDIPWSIDPAGGTERLQCALDVIEKALELICDRHKLAFAQTWIASNGGSSTGSVLSTTKKGSCMLLKKASAFRKDCNQFPLQKGQGVVGWAFSSRALCFCKDVTQLDITQYPLVTSARKAGLSSSFAICLQEMGTGDVYVLEFFLTTIQTASRDPTIFLSSLVAKMKKHFHRFVVASGEVLGKQIAVEVINNSVEEPDSFIICQPISSEPKVEDLECRERMLLNSTNKTSTGGAEGTANRRNHVTSNERFVRPLTIAELSPHGQEKVQSVDPMSNSRATLKAEQKDLILLEKQSTVKMSKVQQINTMKHNVKMLDATSMVVHNPRKHSKAQPDDQDAKRCRTEIGRKDQTSAISASTVHPSSALIRSLQAIEILDETPITVKAVYKDDIIKFQLLLSARVTDFQDQVMMRLKLGGKSYLIKCQDKDNNLISIDSDADLQNYMRTMRSLNKTSIKFFLESKANESD